MSSTYCVKKLSGSFFCTNSFSREEFPPSSFESILVFTTLVFSVLVSSGGTPGLGGIKFVLTPQDIPIVDTPNRIAILIKILPFRFWTFMLYFLRRCGNKGGGGFKALLRKCDTRLLSARGYAEEDRLPTHPYGEG